MKAQITASFLLSGFAFFLVGESQENHDSLPSNLRLNGDSITKILRENKEEILQNQMKLEDRVFNNIKMERNLMGKHHIVLLLSLLSGQMIPLFLNYWRVTEMEMLPVNWLILLCPDVLIIYQMKKDNSLKRMPCMLYQLGKMPSLF